MAANYISQREISRKVRAAIAQAVHAVQQQNIEGMAEGLRAALSVYEECPTQVHTPLSHFRDLLVLIRAARSFCATLGRLDDDLAALEARAEALRRPLH